MTDLKELLRCVEQAEGPDREIDGTIAVALDGFWAEPPRYDGDGIRYCMRDNDGIVMKPGNAGDMMVPRYTASLDAAVALVERRLPGWAWHISRIVGVPSRSPLKDCDARIWRPAAASISVARIHGDENANGNADTPALAICTALLRAELSRSETAKGDDNGGSPG